MRTDAERRARQTIETAQRQADDIVADARAKTDRIRSESERELAALTHRRDSINAQLHNVREMLATLTGGGAALAGLNLDSDDKEDATVASLRALAESREGLWQSATSRYQ